MTDFKSHAQRKQTVKTNASHLICEFGKWGGYVVLKLEKGPGLPFIFRPHPGVGWGLWVLLMIPIPSHRPSPTGIQRTTGPGDPPSPPPPPQTLSRQRPTGAAAAPLAPCRPSKSPPPALSASSTPSGTSSATADGPHSRPHLQTYPFLKDMPPRVYNGLSKGQWPPPPACPTPVQAGCQPTLAPLSAPSSQTASMVVH